MQDMFKRALLEGPRKVAAIVGMGLTEEGRTLEQVAVDKVT